MALGRKVKIFNFSSICSSCGRRQVAKNRFVCTIELKLLVFDVLLLREVKVSFLKKRKIADFMLKFCLFKKMMV